MGVSECCEMFGKTNLCQRTLHELEDWHAFMKTSFIFVNVQNF